MAAIYVRGPAYFRIAGNSEWSRNVEKITAARKSGGPRTEMSAEHVTVEPHFALVRTKRVFEDICEQIRSAMAEGTLKPGDKLPAERDLAFKFGVSRTAVREALRSLEIVGVVGLQKGTKGGAFILKGDPDVVTQSIQDMFYLGRISLDGLTEARTLIMQMAVGLACERIKPQLLTALHANNKRLSELKPGGPVAERIAVSQEFYHLIANATRNEVVQVVVESLSAIVLQLVNNSNWDTVPRLLAHRRRLVACLESGDVAGAQLEIAEHLKRLHRQLLRQRTTR